MRANGRQGVTGASKVCTTVSDPAAQRAPDLVDRQFKVGAPNKLVVADFTYVTMAGGWFAYHLVRGRRLRRQDRRLGMFNIETDRLR